MIQVIRYGVFETNSSSSHSFSLVSKDSDFLGGNKQSDKELEEEARDYSKKNNVGMEEARKEIFLDSIIDFPNYKASTTGKLNFCESLVIYLGKKIPNFNSETYLKRIKELLQNEKRLDSYRFACDRRIKPTISEEDFFIYMIDDELIGNAEELFMDLSNVDVVCYSIKNIVIDTNVAIEIESSYFY